MSLDEIFSFNESDKELLKMEIKEFFLKKISYSPLKYNKNKKKLGNAFIVDIGGSFLKFGYFEDNIETINESIPIRTDFFTEQDFFDWALKEIIFFFSDRLKNKCYTSILILSYDITYTKDGVYVNKYSKHLSKIKRDNFNIKKFFDKNLSYNFFRFYANDALSTILSQNLQDDRFNIALIYGTGINISFFVDGKILITEIAKFHSDFLPVNQFDQIILNELQLKREDFRTMEIMTSTFYLEKYIFLLKKSYPHLRDKDVEKIFYNRGFEILLFFILIINEEYNMKGRRIKLILTGSPLKDDCIFSLMKGKIHAILGEVEIEFMQDATIKGGLEILSHLK